MLNVIQDCDAEMLAPAASVGIIPATPSLGEHCSDLLPHPVIHISIQGPGSNLVLSWILVGDIGYDCLRLMHDVSRSEL